MNKLILKEFDGKHIIYLYQPEGRGEYGEVTYSIADKAARITKRAGENSLWHDNKAIRKVEERAGENNLPVKYTHVWY